QALELAVARCDVRVRQAAGPGRGVADRDTPPLQQPDRIVRMGQDRALLLDGVGVAQEAGQVLRRIEMAEGFGEGACGEGRQRFGVVGGGAADGEGHGEAGGGWWFVVGGGGLYYQLPTSSGVARRMVNGMKKQLVVGRWWRRTVLP